MSEIERMVSNVASAVSTVASPYADAPPPPERGALVEAAVQREIAEVQAGVIMAHRFPRDEILATDKIIRACTRPTLAQGALYNYSRGGTEITGPSIRLAEVLAQNWGNVKFGWKEVKRVQADRDPVTGRWKPGYSEVMAYAWDLETNVPVERGFQLVHERRSKGNVTRLEENRDIYEAAANEAARRMRACILAVIPGDIVEAAVEQCEATMLAKADTSPEAVAKLVEAFAEFGVTKDQIEQRIQRRLDTIRPAQVVQLRKTWRSLADGMSVASDWFQPPRTPEGQPAPQPEAKGNEGLKAKLRPQAPETPVQADSAPADAPPTVGLATPAYEPGTATGGGSPATSAATSPPEAMELETRPQDAAQPAAGSKPTSASATRASPASPDPKASGPRGRGEPSSAGELPLREPGEEG
jgi:hypothetical protein